MSGGIPGCSRAVGKAGAVLGPGEVEVPPPGVGAGAEVEEAGHPFHFDSQRERESRGWRWHSPVKESSEKAFTHGGMVCKRLPVFRNTMVGTMTYVITS